MSKEQHIQVGTMVRFRPGSQPHAYASPVGRTMPRRVNGIRILQNDNGTARNVWLTLEGRTFEVSVIDVEVA